MTDDDKEENVHIEGENINYKSHNTNIEGSNIEGSNINTNDGNSSKNKIIGIVSASIVAIVGVVATYLMGWLPQPPGN